MQRVKHYSSAEMEKPTPSLRSAGIDPNTSISSFMKRNVEYVNENDTVYELIEKIINTGYRRFPVITKKRFPRRDVLVGVITVMDILDAFLRDVDFNGKVKEIMNRDIVFCYKEEAIGAVLKKFKFSKRGGFPVIDENNAIANLLDFSHVVRRIKHGYSSFFPNLKQ